MGRKSLAFCWANVSGKAAMPATIAAARKPSEMKAQSTPQHADDPPYRLANTDASDSSTLRAIRSSYCSERAGAKARATVVSQPRAGEKRGRAVRAAATHDVEGRVQAGHGAHEEDVKAQGLGLLDEPEADCEGEGGEGQGQDGRWEVEPAVGVALPGV